MPFDFPMTCPLTSVIFHGHEPLKTTVSIFNTKLVQFLLNDFGGTPILGNLQLLMSNQVCCCSSVNMRSLNQSKRGFEQRKSPKKQASALGLNMVSPKWVVSIADWWFGT